MAPLTLYGQAAGIEILLGAPGWSEGARARFTGARWDFWPDGTFRFMPDRAADYRDDLYPLYGSWRRIEEVLELRAGRHSPLGARSLLIGFLRHFSTAPEVVLVQATVSMTACVVRVVQPLTAVPPVREDREWPPVPATYVVTLAGRIAGEPFGALPGTVTIGRPAEGDSNPVSVTLQTTDPAVHGSVYWSSFLAATEPKARFCAVTVDAERQTLDLRVVPHAANPLAPTWWRLASPPSFPALPALPDIVAVEEGTIRLQGRANGLRGEVVSRGRSWLSGEVLCEATLEGTLQEEDRLDPPPPEPPDTEVPPCGGLWRGGPFGDLHLSEEGADGEVQGVLGDGSRLTGRLDGRVLAVHRREGRGRQGNGLFLALPDRRHLAGLLLAATGEWQAGVLERSDLPDPASSEVEGASREHLRDLGYQLVLEGRTVEAVPLLERALVLYRLDRHRADLWQPLREGSLIDEINLLTRLVFCLQLLGRFDDLLLRLREIVQVHGLVSHVDHLRPLERENAPGTQDHAISALAAFRRQAGSDFEKIRLQDASRSFFEELVLLLLDLGCETEALVASEQSRARAFVDLLAAGEPLRVLPAGEVVSAGIAAPVTADALRAAARRLRSTLVEYLLTGDRLICWVVTPQGEVRCAVVAVEEGAVEALVRQLLRRLGATSLGPDEDRRGAELLDPAHRWRGQLHTLLRQLHDLLIAPIADHLPVEPEARVVFVPQGALFQVPFPTLLDAADRPLLERWTSTIAPAVLGVLDSHRPLDPSPWTAVDVLVVGDPVMPPAAADLGPLPGAAEEALKVAELFGATPLRGAAATKEAVLAALPGARLVHLATHGLLAHGRDGELPGALAFTAGAGDGLLTASEIAALKLSADLVVLSACDTGAGRITGDGVAGLARAFLTAGARGVVVSLWPVDDRATAFLMIELYRRLVAGGGGATALHGAMRATRELFKDPERWAGFAFAGRDPAAEASP